ncbi:MAG: hypothetical protein WC254_03075 [Candidatus Woesearchaeota archaeon]|jgi:hypothetical protein
MDIFEKKYGFKENEKIIAFHRNRRMFCIYNNKLYIAEPKVPYSHAVWFENEGWISKEKDELINEIVRGIIDNTGNIYFYIGYDFKINAKIESIFFPYLKELVKSLNLDSNAQLFGGLIKQKEGDLWPPRKRYGKIKDNM